MYEYVSFYSDYGFVWDISAEKELLYLMILQMVYLVCICVHVSVCSMLFSHNNPEHVQKIK